MVTRTAVITLGLALAACNQSAPPAAEAGTAAESATPGADSSGNALPVAAELLAGNVPTGTWEAVGDEATTGVRFTSPDFPDTLTIGCNDGSGEAFIVWTPPNPIAITNPADERFPTQDGEMRVTTAAETVTFPATGSNIDGHMLSVSVPGNDLRLGVLKTVQERFAVQGFGQAVVVPWEASVGAALNACAG